MQQKTSPLQEAQQTRVLNLCRDEWKKRKFVGKQRLADLAQVLAGELGTHEPIRRLVSAFNASDLSIKAINDLARSGDSEAQEMREVLDQYGLDTPGLIVPIGAKDYHELRAALRERPELLFEGTELRGYPYHVPGRTYCYRLDWVRETLIRSGELLEKLQQSRTHDIAVLVGNGPSLNKTDLSLLSGQDVFISNYAVNHPILSQAAKAVAVTNYLVAEQEPYSFFLKSNLWKVFPFWLRNTFVPDDRTILLNADGGELFFSRDVKKRIAWHSTVTYFWMQVLLHVGYKKVLMIGFDHSYVQSKTAKEGDLIKQTEPDPNHFDPSYFLGKQWQAADVSKMEEAYLMAKDAYENAGREIVNCTVGGALEAFRRAALENEIDTPTRNKPLGANAPQALPKRDPKIAVITPFWKGDAESAERLWRLVNRLGKPTYDHLFLFKHGPEDLPPVTMPSISFASIEKRYPTQSALPHPAGPNLLFAHAVKTLRDTDYTHFFWLEPDCIPVSRDWLMPFIEGAKLHPDEPIIGVGGGTTVPNQPNWRNHFAGCSLYNIEKLSALDWGQFINSNLHISFDIWMTVKLGFISLGAIDNTDQGGDTIIYGANRHRWSLVRRPPSVVKGMFEHWRPYKFLSKEQLRDRIRSGSFQLFHAIKDEDLVRDTFASLPKSASAIIINYNNDKYIGEAIRSALGQVSLDGVDYEVIVVDDGSTDSSREIIASFGKHIKPIYLTHGLELANYNQQRAILQGLDAAKGDIVMLLDGDDTFYPTKAASVLAAFENPDVVLVQHGLKRVDEAGKEVEVPAAFFPSSSKELNFDHYAREGRANFYQPTSGLSFRRSYLTYARRWLKRDQFERTWLDVRLTRLAPRYGKVVSLHSVLGEWRRHAKSDSIRQDNVVERVAEHHAWLNHAGAEFGYSLKYTPKYQSMQPTKPTLEYLRSHAAGVDETAVVALLFQAKRGGENIMLDVGAHFGTSAAAFTPLGWRIVCFEPDPSNRAKLVTRFGNTPGVTIDPRAVGEKPESGRAFFTSEESTGISGMLRFRDTHKEVTKVEVTTVAEAIKIYNLPRIDFLKIDVEGYDFAVLKGVPWDRMRPAVIECEFEDAKTNLLGHSTSDIAEFLQSKGYSVYISEWHPIVRYGISHDWHRLTRYPDQAPSRDAWGNILAFLNDPGYTALSDAFQKRIKFRPAGASEKAQTTTATPVKPSENVPSTTETKTLQVAANKDGSSSGRISAQRPYKATHWSPSLYTRVAMTIQERSPILLKLGRFVMWSLRTARRYAPYTIIWLAATVATGVGALVSDTIRWPMLAIFLALAAAAPLAALIGYATLGSRQKARALEQEVRWLKASLTRLESKEARDVAAITRTFDTQKAGAEKLDKLVSTLTDEFKGLRARADEVDELVRSVSLTSEAGQRQAYEELESVVSSLVTEVGQHRTRTDELDTTIASLTSNLDQVRQQLDTAMQSLTDELVKARGQIQATATASSLEEVKQQLDVAVQSLTQELADVRERIQATATVAEQAPQVAQRLQDLSTHLARTPTLSYLRFQAFNRQLDSKSIQGLQRWAKLLNLDMNDRGIAYLATRISQLEMQLHGRLATSIEDIILRCLVTMAARGSPRSVLEIGTLFGVGAAALHEALLFDERGVHLTLLDPLDGYYGKDNIDIMTRQPVNAAVLHKNFELAGIDPKSYTLIQHFSSEPEAIEKASANRYDVLIIDGDHSFEGVKLDFETYRRFVGVGGFIIVDDYGSPEWPTVTEYVDKFVKSASGLEFVGAEWRTAIFRVALISSAQPTPV